MQSLVENVCFSAPFCALKSAWTIIVHLLCLVPIYREKCSADHILTLGLLHEPKRSHMGSGC